MKEGHARLQQIGEHGVVQLDAGVHADLHEEEAAEYCRKGACENAKCVNVYSIHGTEQTVRIQGEDR